jgi:arabinose-5-phosphate isomerase
MENKVEMINRMLNEDKKFLDMAQNVLHAEAEAIEALISKLGDGFISAIRMMLACKGRVVVSGMGKSGHIGRKISATLSSTGTPSFFVHPGEASHGDLGMITSEDVAILLSNSGEGSEVLAIVPILKRMGSKLIALTGNPGSTLALLVDIHLYAGASQEACPLGLAPSASTTAALAMGDALALTLLDAKGFSAEDFARSHPGGALGRRLLIRVSDIMHAGDRLPVVAPDTPLVDVLYEISSKGMGMAAIAGASGELTGIYTDGDLRRTLQKGLDIRYLTASDVMKNNPHTIQADHLASEAVKYMQDYKVNGLLVVDAQSRLVGALNMHDLFVAGVV